MASTTFISSAFFFLFLLLTSFSEAQSDKNEAQSDNSLYSGEDLVAGDYLEFDIYTFIMQRDCNLVLYQNKNKPIWATNTGCLAKNCYLSLRKDGNLVIYKPNGSPLWASNTGRGQGNYVLILQEDRNVVIYGGVIWNTKTTEKYESSLSSKPGGAGAMDIVSITNLPSPIIYTDGIDLAKNVTTGVTGGITTRAGRVA